MSELRIIGDHRRELTARLGTDPAGFVEAVELLHTAATDLLGEEHQVTWVLGDMIDLLRVAAE